MSAETVTRSTYTYTTQYTYDTGTDNKTTGRVSGISYTRGETAKGGYTYEYDGNGNITEIYESGTLKASYHYDAQNQLVREDNMDLGTAGQTVVYAYDAGGNILSKKTYAYTDPAAAVSGTPTDTVNYSYTDTVWKDKLTSFNGKAITYDEIGNPLTYGTGDEQWSFTWQRGRQLASLTTPDHTISYKYNADGLRTEKTVDGVTWEYVWDGSKLIAMYDGTTEWRFIYDAGGEVVGFIYGASTYYYVKNLQGDVIKILDNYCNEIVTYTYDSWGNLISQGGSSAYVSLGQKNPIRYRGYFYDTDTGLYYLQSRYYNPQWGRFINADGTFWGGVNLFAYCYNNPVNMVDPTGYCSGTFVGRCPVCGEWMGNSYMQDKYSGNNSNLLITSTHEANRRPYTGEPGSTWKSPNGDTRTYGPDGKPLHDYDHDDHGYPDKHPHDENGGHNHDWEDGKRGEAYEIDWKPVAGVALVAVCVVGIAAVAADNATGVGFGDDFLFAPLGSGVMKGLAMAFG